MAWDASMMRADSGEPDLAFDVDIPAEMTEAMAVSGVIAPRVTRQLALQVPAVLRARNMIAGTLGGLPIHIRDSERRIATPTTLLEQIDPDIPNVVTFAETYEDLLFEGVSWWRITKFGWHDYPVEAVHVDVNRVSVSGWVPPVNGQSPSTALGPVGVMIDGRRVADEDVIRFDSPNPPLLKHAARAIRTCLNLDLTAAGYSNDPVPLGYFTPREGQRPREDKETIEAMLDTWEEARRRRVWGYIGAAWDAKQFQFNAEQIQLAEQRQHAVLEIARAAGIDPEDLGVSTTSRTYQNSEQRRQDMLDFTFAPFMHAVEQRLSMRDVIPRGYEAKVNLDSFLRSDTLGRMNAYKIGLEVGAYTPEEIRVLEDRPDIPKPPAAAPVAAPPMPAVEEAPSV